jgi:hypothetical protein
MIFSILWRVFAPRWMKRTRRAMHPSWVVKDAVVRRARRRFNKKRR